MNTKFNNLYKKIIMQYFYFNDANKNNIQKVNDTVQNYDNTIQDNPIQNNPIQDNPIQSNKSFDPDTQPLFTKEEQLDNGITIYSIQDSRAGYIAASRAVRARFKHGGPWCLLQHNTYDNSYKFWQYYKGPKKIAYKKGKPIAFYADNHWRDTFDNPVDIYSL